MAKRVLIPQDVAAEGKVFLRERGYEIKMGSGATVDAIAADVVDCDAILARTAPFPAEVLEAGPELSVVARHGVGVDNVDVKRAEELGIWVTNAPESNAGTVAETVIGLIVAAARSFLPADREMRRGNWGVRSRLTSVDVEGKTLGILGLGRIGRKVARKAAGGLDMRVVGYDPYVASIDGVTLLDSVEAVCREADFLTVHVPALPETRGLINSHIFSIMKPAAYFINAARGELVDEAALVEALASHRIAGAALDVYAEEPPAADHPLLSLDNVILLPHSAALTSECLVRMAVHAAMGIDEALSGRRPAWAVNNPPKPRNGAVGKAATRKDTAGS